MKFSDDVIASINENFVNISAGWMWADVLIYNIGYGQYLSQPVSVEAATLNDFRFKETSGTITIRQSDNPLSLVLWSGYVEFAEDPITVDPVVDIPSVNTGVAAEAISIDSLVGMTMAGLVRADAELAIEAIGIALNSGSAGESIRYSPTGKIVALTVPFAAGTELYAGTSGNLTDSPTTGISQRVGTATAAGATITVQQPIILEA